MTASDLIERLARTTYMSHDDATVLVWKGIRLDISVADMEQFGEDLQQAIEGVAMGLTVKQLLGWREKLPFLLMAVRRLGVRPSDVPDAPPVH